MNINKINEENKDDKIKDDKIKDNSSDIDVYESFDDMNLNSNLLRGIYSYGFEKPSSIQQRGIIPLINGRDIIGQAQSGTGKTATFVIGLIQKLDIKKTYCQTIVIAPTRELASQIYKVLKDLSTYVKCNYYLCIGGCPVHQNIRDLKYNTYHAIIGTPGRTYDMIKRNALDVSKLELLIIDEADEMLSRGFKEQIYNIFQEVPNDIQVGLFSATMPPDILEISDKFMRKTIRILVNKEQLTLEGIKQFYINVEKEDWKYDTLSDLYDKISISQSIIYCNQKKKVVELAKTLTENDFEVSFVHGDMSQDDRDSVMQQFKSGASRVLISTDLLARGIDIQSVSMVINYDLPYIKENYIHRIGRTGRYGRKGVAINFINDQDVESLKNIERYYDTQIEEMPANFTDYL